MNLLSDDPHCPYCAEHSWLGAIPHYPIDRITLLERLLIAVLRAHRVRVVAWVIGRAMRRGDYALAVHDGCLASEYSFAKRNAKSDGWTLSFSDAAFYSIVTMGIALCVFYIGVLIVFATKGPIGEQKSEISEKPEPLIQCTSRHTPQSNWYEALKDAEPGDVICLESGIYRVNTNIILPYGTKDEPITISGTNRTDVKLHFDGATMHLFHHVIIRNLSAKYISCSRDSMFTIDKMSYNCELRDIVIDSSDCPDAKLFADYYITNDPPEVVKVGTPDNHLTITKGSTGGVSIHTNIVHDNDAQGIFLGHNSPENSVIRNNIISNDVYKRTEPTSFYTRCQPTGDGNTCTYTEPINAD